MLPHTRPQSTFMVFPQLIQNNYSCMLFYKVWRQFYQVKQFKRESARDSSNLWTKPYYQHYRSPQFKLYDLLYIRLHYLQCFANFYATILINTFLNEIIFNDTKCRKQMLKFISNTICLVKVEIALLPIGFLLNSLESTSAILLLFTKSK